MIPNPLPLCSALDPRSSDVAALYPFADSVNIPLEELAERTYELPRRETPLKVAAREPLLAQTLEVLRDIGRTGYGVVPVSAPEPVLQRLWAPNEFLVECLPTMGRKSLAWDLACGSGRDAVYMAAHGWRVTGFDILPDALDRARRLEERYLGTTGKIAWRALDLTDGLAVAGDPGLVSMFFYFNRQVLGESIARLGAGGYLILETFSSAHRERYGRPASESLVATSEIVVPLLNGFDILHLSEDEREDRRHTLRLLARRISGDRPE